jgi:hypothetical protein
MPADAAPLAGAASGLTFGALKAVGLDEGFSSLSPSNLVYTENPLSYKKWQWRITVRPRISVQVMRRAAAAVAELIGEVPLACRTDCAVDGAAGCIVLNEIEGGLDFSVFPDQVTSYDSTGGITAAAIAELVAKLEG